MSVLLTRLFCFFLETGDWALDMLESESEVPEERALLGDSGKLDPTIGVPVADVEMTVCSLAFDEELPASPPTCSLLSLSKLSLSMSSTLKL